MSEVVVTTDPDFLVTVVMSPFTVTVTTPGPQGPPGDGESGGGTSDHGELEGLADDDHTQYLNNTRGDARYYTKSQSDAAYDDAGEAVAQASAAAAFAVQRANHTGSQAATTITEDATHRFATDAEKTSLTNVIASDALKAPIASPTFTGTVGGVTKAMVGLGSVDNTADTAKPVSTAQQTALNLKADLVSPALTGTPTAPTPSTPDDSTQIATTAFVKAQGYATSASGGLSAAEVGARVTYGV